MKREQGGHYLFPRSGKCQFPEQKAHYPFPRRRKQGQAQAEKRKSIGREKEKKKNNGSRRRKKEREARGQQDRGKEERRAGRQEDKGEKQKRPGQHWIVRVSRKTAAAYSPTWWGSTIGDGELNFSVRDGKRWFLTAIATAICELREIIEFRKDFGQLVQIG